MILTFNISGNYLIRYLFIFFQCVWKHKNCFELTYSNISNLNGFIAVYQYLIVHWGKKMKTPLDEDLIPILSKYLYSQISVKLLISSYIIVFVCLMVFNATFNNISVISCWSFLLVEKLEDPEKTTDLLQVTDKLDHIMLYTSPWSRFVLTTSVVMSTDCIGSCKSNYHTIMASTAPSYIINL